MRKPIIVGNWKMNTTLGDATVIATSVKNIVADLDVDVVLCPPYVWLYPLSEILDRAPKNIHLGAQNMWYEENGPMTGEISASMVKSLAKYVIIGHSERRANFRENDDLVNLKVKAALEHNLIPILCVGETKKMSDEDMKTGQFGIIHELAKSLENITTDDLEKIVICYEPIWAISNGTVESRNAADGAYVNFVIEKIREYLAKKYDGNLAERIKIIYGGSVCEDNIKEYLAQPEIDGALVGGASLNAKEFVKICRDAAGRD